MKILILTSLGVFFALSILFLALYLRIKNRYGRLNDMSSDLVSKLSKSEQNCENLTKKIDQIKDDLSTKRIGYYTDSVNLISIENKEAGKPGEPYHFTVFIKELDRYTNGMSKIILTNIEVTSGFASDKYDWVKQVTREKFSTLKKTSEIKWLESEESIKEQRKQKLEKILNINEK